MKARLILVAAAACLAALFSCSPSENDDNGSGKKNYAKIIVNGETWPEAEISFSKATVSDDQVPFRLILDAEQTRANTGYLFYSPEDEEVTIDILYRDSAKGEYMADMKIKQGSISKKSDTEYAIDIDGTDSEGNNLVVKGVAKGN